MGRYSWGRYWGNSSSAISASCRSMGRVRWTGPGRPRGGGAESRRHVLGDAPLVVDQPRPLRDRIGHADLVDLLEGGHALLRQLGAARHEDDRAFRCVDRRQCRDGVGESRPAGEDAHRWLAGDAGVAVGHVQGSALVAGVDKLDTLILRGVHQGQNGVTNDGEHLLDALLLQTADEQVTSGESRHGPSLNSLFNHPTQTHPAQAGEPDLPSTSRGLNPKVFRACFSPSMIYDSLSDARRYPNVTPCALAL